eukprot:2691728-Karenia_brevis.AAC.1
MHQPPRFWVRPPWAELPPWKISFSAAISAGDIGGHWERLLDLLAPLRLYVATMSACEKSGQWQRRAALQEAVPFLAMEALNVIKFNAAIPASTPACCSTT